MPHPKLIMLVCVLWVSSAFSKYVPFLEQDFYFDYNKPGQPITIPVTEQCERIHIVWGRQIARGANPVAPYFMQVYTSTFIVPFIIPVGNGLTFDWDVPFAPGTQYQICMYDRNGLAGGCQAMYTVIQNSTTLQPTCQNVTFPALLLVDATVSGGPMSQYGFIDQCTDVSITPMSGIPPFVLTVSPSLHPPYNLTSDSMASIDWTVSLPRSYPFFISLSSSDGKVWSNGPLHAGAFGPSDCLAPGTVPRSSARQIALGVGFGGVIGGVILGLSFFCLYSRTYPPARPPGPDPENNNGVRTQLQPGLGIERPLPPIPVPHREGLKLRILNWPSQGSRNGSVTPYTFTPSTDSPAGTFKHSAMYSMTDPPQLPLRVPSPTSIIQEEFSKYLYTPTNTHSAELENTESPPVYVRYPEKSASP